MSLAELSLTWLRPWWLLALLPLVGLAGRAVWQRRRSRGAQTRGVVSRADSPWSSWVDVPLQRHVLVEAKAIPMAHVPQGAAAVLGLATLLVVALAGPAVPAPEQTTRAARPSLTRVVLVDLSPAFSALAEPDLQRVRGKLQRALHRLPAAETALLVYAQEAYLVVPPSTDIAPVAQFLPDLSSSAMPLAGDRPEAALQLISELLARRPADPAEVLWVSPASPARLAAALAASGLADSVPVHLWSISGSPQMPRRVGRLAVVPLAPDDLDLEVLHASASSGELRGGEAALRGGWLDLGPYLVLLALPLAAVALARERGFLLVAGVALAGSLTAWPSPAAASEVTGAVDPRWRAVALYRAGDYAAAAAVWEPYNDADALYNRGNALAHAGRLIDALALYEAALAKRPEDADFRHNRDLLQRLLQPPPQMGGRGPAPRQAAAGEAARLAEHWSRRVPDAPAPVPGQPTLLQRKLQLEHERRVLAAKGGTP